MIHRVFPCTLAFDRRKCSSSLRRFCVGGYTLIEILVVLFVLMLVAAIALPTVKDLLSNQKINRAAVNLNAFVDKARSRAIAEQRPCGILIERGVGVDDTGNVIGLSQSIRMRQVMGVPPYAGDASNAYATLNPYPNNVNLAIAEFTVKDNQLLSLSRDIYSDTSLTPQARDDAAPIRNGDYIELPGGRLVPIRFLVSDPFASNDQEPKVRLWFNLTRLYPDGARDLSNKPRVKYRIHRRPVVSSVSPFSLPRGVVIDLNFSGIGVTGNQLASLSDDKDIEIIFGADGSVLRVTNGWYWDSGNDVAAWDQTQVPPLGSIFLCLGDADGLVPNNLFSQDKRALSNLFNLESIWLSINPYTGRCNSSPNSAIDLPGVLANAGLRANSVLQTPNPDPQTGDSVALQDAIYQSRYFATLSDSVNPE